MAIKVVCKCGAKFNAREELAGKAIECTACGNKVSVPHPVAAGGGGVGKGPVIFGMLLLGAAIAGCGYMIFTQQETIKELKSSLDAQRGKVETLDGSLQAAAQRVDGLKSALDSTTAATASLSAGQLTDKKSIEAVKQDLAAESDRRRKLGTELDRLDTDALRIRSSIAEAQKAREDEWEKLSAANRDKQKEYEVQIAKLQEEMATKADDKSAQDRLAAEVKRIEDARSGLVAQANADRSKLATYDTRIDQLNRELQAKLAKQNQLQYDLRQAQTKLTQLDKTVNKPTLPAQLNTLQQKVDKVNQATAPNVETLTFDDQVRGQAMWFRLDTRTGSVSYKTPTDSGVIRGGPAFAGWGQQQQQPAGRYAIEYTADTRGNIGEVVLFDTQEGAIWSCYIGMNRMASLNWRRLMLWKFPAPAGPASQGKWRLSVSRDGGRGMLVLTDPNGTVYDDSLAYRRWLIPTYP